MIENPKRRFILVLLSIVTIVLIAAAAFSTDAVSLVSGEAASDTVGETIEPRTPTYRRRRAVRRSLPAGDQIKRSLQGY